MSDVEVIEILLGALNLVTRLAGPLLAATLIIGVVVSILQTVTQIQEMTLTFVPKLVAAAAILVFAGNWMLRELVGWTTLLWESIGSM
ncbi:MAG: flagellar biosynthetic protein FliQ [Acidimicrobiia bacterium]|nr:flagellar biosynthetic protein FliQ [Acidimicrobiia bacterium]MDH4306998.1 flagellar biosynthetic protein FliQ [Acidimicrobiia bacterium]MDH5292238.1 flagellar biosynthetic protein FliQ [Acidimicrobiia bacterium]MDH5522185.1 flagellar biosynthetic protein FliQ [Acidimicrobiia bacterium]